MEDSKRYTSFHHSSRRPSGHGVVGHPENPSDLSLGGLRILARKTINGSQRWKVSISQPAQKSVVFQGLRTLAATDGVYVILSGLAASQIESLNPDAGQPRWIVEIPDQLREDELEDAVLLIGG